MHNQVALEFDPLKAAENLRKHGISFAHAEQALRDPSAVTIDDPDSHGERRFITLGTDLLGRILVVVCRATSGRGSFPLAKPPLAREKLMRKEYDFSKGKRGPVIPSPGKTRITMMLDDDIIEAFRKRAEDAGRGYQTLINDVLRCVLHPDEQPVTAKMLRKILREELRAA